MSALSCSAWVIMMPWPVAATRHEQHRLAGAPVLVVQGGAVV
jgi:hypothetical protein